MMVTFLGHQVIGACVGLCLLLGAVQAVAQNSAQSLPSAQADTPSDSRDQPQVAGTQITLTTLADYMENLDKGWIQFSQLNTDGTISTGNILFGRPSYARIEYDPPASGLVIAESIRVAVFDLKSNSEPVFFLLATTPLYYLLRNNVRIDDSDLLVDYRVGAASSEVALRGPNKSEKILIRLAFQHDPVRLAGWTFIDQFGQQTRMIFENFVQDIVIEREMFSIQHEIERQSR